MKSLTRSARWAVVAVTAALTIAGCATAIPGTPVAGGKSKGPVAATTSVVSSTVPRSPQTPVSRTQPSKPLKTPQSSVPKTPVSKPLVPKTPASKLTSPPVTSASVDLNPANYRPFDIGGIHKKLIDLRLAEKKSAVTVDPALVTEAQQCALKVINGNRECGQMFYWGPPDPERVMSVFKRGDILPYTLYEGVKRLGCGGVKNAQNYAFVACIYRN